MKAIDQVSKRLAALEAKVSTTVIGKIVAVEGNRRATIHLGDASHPLLHVPCVSSYYPRVGQSVRVQRSGDKLLILGSTTFDQSTVISDTAPTPPYPGQLWYDTNESVLKSWDGSAWVKLGATDQTARDAAGAAKTAADLASWIADQASTSANGKNHNYYGTTFPTSPPTNLVDGDMFFDQSLTTDGYIKNTPYIWRVVNGVGSWVLTRDDLMRSNLNTALTAANGKNKIYFQTTMPTGGTYNAGDIWYDTTLDTVTPASSSNYPNPYPTNPALAGTPIPGTPLSIKRNAMYIYETPANTFVQHKLGVTTIEKGVITTDMINVSGLNAAAITAGTIDAAVIVVKNLDASKITVGGMDASRITVGTLGSQVIYSGIVYANKIVAATNANVIGGTTALLVSTANANSVAFQVTTGYSVFNNDIWAGGNLYGNGAGTAVLTRGGITNGYNGQSASTGPGIRNFGALYMPEGQLDCGQLVVGRGPATTYPGLQIPHNTGSGSLRLSNLDYGQLQYTAASSIRYKTEVTDLQAASISADKLLDIPIRQFKYTNDHLPGTDQRHAMLLPGFIAEEIAEHYPVAADLNTDGAPESWNERYLIPGMLALIQSQHRELEAQNDRIKALEERLS